MVGIWRLSLILASYFFRAPPFFCFGSWDRNFDSLCVCDADDIMLMLFSVFDWVVVFVQVILSLLQPLFVAANLFFFSLTDLVVVVVVIVVVVVLLIAP